MKDREKDLTLIKAIKNEDTKAWEDFVSLYSDVIFNSIRHWCQPYCRKSHQKYLCPWKMNSKSRMDLSRETCGEMLDMYLFALDAMKKRIVKFRGESRLSTFIVASLKYIKLDFFRDKYGRLQLPLVIKKTSKVTQEIYKLLCKGKSKEHIAVTLNISEEEVMEKEKEIRKHLRIKGQEWQHLDGWIALKSEPQPLIIEGEDEFIDQTPIHFDITPEEREVVSYLIEGMKTLPHVHQRLLQLRYQKRLPVSEIEKMTDNLNFLNITTQKQIYKELDIALTSLSKFVKSRYDLDQEISNEVKKCIKELLEKILVSSEKDSNLSA